MRSNVDTSPDADATAHAQERVCSGRRGQNAVEHIARLLTKSPQEVQHILRDLQENAPGYSLATFHPILSFRNGVIFNYEKFLSIGRSRFMGSYCLREPEFSGEKRLFRLVVSTYIASRSPQGASFHLRDRIRRGRIAISLHALSRTILVLVALVAYLAPTNRSQMSSIPSIRSSSSAFFSIVGVCHLVGIFSHLASLGNVPAIIYDCGSWRSSPNDKDISISLFCGALCGSDLAHQVMSSGGCRQCASQHLICSRCSSYASF